MAAFETELPYEVIKQLEDLHSGTTQIMGKMVLAGAKVAEAAIRANVPAEFRGSDIMSCLGHTGVYETPSDHGVNYKVGFSGYFTNHNGERVPAPLVCNVYEYGSTKFHKRPFFRKSFNKKAIEDAMMEAQKEASGGVLDE